MTLNKDNIKAIVDCIQCGNRVRPEDANCSACTSPFSTEGWQRTNKRVRTIVLDTCCVNARGADPHLNRLEEWGRRQWVNLQRTPAFMEELEGERRREKAGMIATQPPSFDLDQNALDGLAVLAGPLLDVGLLAHILFPTTKELNAKNLSDIEHLRHLVRVGGHCFCDPRHQRLHCRRKAGAASPHRHLGIHPRTGSEPLTRRLWRATTGGVEVIAAIYARKSTAKRPRRRGEERHPPDRARPRLRGAQGLDGRRRAHLRRRRHQRGRVREAPRVHPADERAQAPAAVPRARHVRGVAASGASRSRPPTR
jgi:hypothetical protein